QKSLKFFVELRFERPFRLTEPRNLRPDLSDGCRIQRIKNPDRLRVELKCTSKATALGRIESLCAYEDGAGDNLPAKLKQHYRTGLCPQPVLLIVESSGRSAGAHQLIEEVLLLNLQNAGAHKPRLFL